MDVVRYSRQCLALVVAAVHVAGCAAVLPGTLVGNTNVIVESTSPPKGSRVQVGSPVTARVKYRVEPYSPGKQYFLLVCSVETCGTSPLASLPVTGKSGTATLSFAYSDQADMVLLVAGEARDTTVYCAPGVKPEHCYPTSTNVIGSDSIVLLATPP